MTPRKLLLRLLRLLLLFTVLGLALVIYWALVVWSTFRRGGGLKLESHRAESPEPHRQPSAEVGGGPDRERSTAPASRAEEPLSDSEEPTSGEDDSGEPVGEEPSGAPEDRPARSRGGRRAPGTAALTRLLKKAYPDPLSEQDLIQLTAYLASRLPPATAAQALGGLTGEGAEQAAARLESAPGGDPDAQEGVRARLGEAGFDDWVRRYA